MSWRGLKASIPMLTILALSLGWIPIGNAQAAGVSVASDAVKTAIVQAVMDDRQIYGMGPKVPGVLVGVWDGQGHSYIAGFGTSDQTTGRPFTAADHVRIGSNTKTFIVSVLLQLVDEGLLKLDDPISKFDIGVTVPNADHITIRELCEMRSGLFEVYDVPEIAKADFPPDMKFDPHTLVRWAVAQKPYFDPGTEYHYSNTNYLILGLVIDSLTKSDVGSVIRDRFLKPYHLDNTSYPETIDMPEPWSHGYSPKPDGSWEDVSKTVPVTMTGAAGNMISDLGDMRHWIELYVDGKTNKPETQKDRLACLPTGKGDAGFGLGIVCSEGWFGYTGGLPGYNTAGWRFPSRNITVIVFVDEQNDNPPPGVANAMLRDIAHIMTPDHTPMQSMTP